MKLATKKYLALVFAIACLSPKGIAAKGDVYEASNDSAPSTAEACSDIDLLAERPMQRWSSAQNQGRINWCGSYAVADAVSYEYGDSISPLSIGSIYQQAIVKTTEPASLPSSFDANSGFGGRPCDLVQIVQDNGVCPTSAIEGSSITASDLDKLVKLYAQFQSVTNLEPLLSREQAVTKAAMTLALPSMNKYLALLARSSVPPTLSSAREFFAALINEKCGPLKKLKSPLTCTYVLKTPGRKLSGNIDRAIAVGLMPIFSFDEFPLYAVSLHAASPAPHALTINARHWNQQKRRCEYRMRNSVDVFSCDQYSNLVTCSDAEVKRGLIWVDAALIDRTGYNIALVKNGGIDIETIAP